LGIESHGAFLYYLNYREFLTANVDGTIIIKIDVTMVQGKRPLGRPRRRWMDNIKKDLLEIGMNVVDWIGLAQDKYRWRALVNSVMNLRVP
jgi:hypothetical protein